jgi:hypothetical protein
LISPVILSLMGYHGTGATVRELQFFTIRYVPDIVTGDFVNIGVVLFDPSGGFCGVRFMNDWGKLQGFDPDVDIQMLEAMSRDIEAEFRSGRGEEILKTMEDSFSNAVQLSPRMILSANKPREEIEKLASLHLGKSMNT